MGREGEMGKEEPRGTVQPRGTAHPNGFCFPSLNYPPSAPIRWTCSSTCTRTPPPVAPSCSATRHRLPPPPRRCGRQWASPPTPWSGSAASPSELSSLLFQSFQSSECSPHSGSWTTNPAGPAASPPAPDVSHPHLTCPPLALTGSCRGCCPTASASPSAPRRTGP